MKQMTESSVQGNKTTGPTDQTRTELQDHEEQQDNIEGNYGGMAGDQDAEQAGTGHPAKAGLSVDPAYNDMGVMV